jgi:Bacterial mobilisation protein (MobC)
VEFLWNSACRIGAVEPTKASMARTRTDYIGERRTEYFGFQLTPTERRNLVRGAEERGMLMAEYVRGYLPLGTLPNGTNHQQRRPPETVALVGELGRIGNNLNQLARRANETRRIPEETLLRAVINELKVVFGRIV